MGIEQIGEWGSKFAAVIDVHYLAARCVGIPPSADSASLSQNWKAENYAEQQPKTSTGMRKRPAFRTKNGQKARVKSDQPVFHKILLLSLLLPPDEKHSASKRNTILQNQPAAVMTDRTNFLQTNRC